MEAAGPANNSRQVSLIAEGNGDLGPGGWNAADLNASANQNEIINLNGEKNVFNIEIRACYSTYFLATVSSGNFQLLREMNNAGGDESNGTERNRVTVVSSNDGPAENDSRDDLCAEVHTEKV